MIKDAFSHVTTWVFDLDNTLYPPHMRLFDQIEDRMVQFVMQHLKVERPEADRLRKVYWQQYGTTLAGLMREHDLDPHQFLIDVHDICFDPLAPDPSLAEQIRRLPGRKIIYTNGTAPYAEKVIDARGLSGLFDAVYGVEHAGFHPKPDAQAFETVFGQDGFNTTTAAMFEDEARNLAVPFALGLTTVHVAPTAHVAPFVMHHTADLTGFLSQLADP